MRLRARSDINVSRQVRNTYEELPYPAVSKTARLGRAWRIAPIEWIDAMWQPDLPAPRQILVAGCGTGNEAFAFCRHFPNAEVTAVDFSSRSIKIARQLQQRLSQPKRVRFLCADLITSPLRKVVRDKFDLVSCHGVLSYVPRPEKALHNLVDCMTPNGALYLGVNGVGHFSEKWRQSLARFGFDLNRFEDSSRLRQILRLHDALTGFSIGTIANQGPEFLASDLFGPMISNRRLAYWTALCRQCGLYFSGSYLAHQSLRQALNNDLYDLFIPRSRAEAHQLVEQISPSSFHYLVFAPRLETKLPWLAPEILKCCRVSATGIYARRWPKRTKSWRALRHVTIRSKPTNTLVDLRAPEWVIEILRRSGEEKTLSKILGDVLGKVSGQSLRKHLYLLYLLALINLSPPQMKPAQVQNYGSLG